MSRLHVSGVAGLVIAAVFAFQSALASSALVPDEFSTVQLAIDSGADTILIREGSYPERPAVDRAVVLKGLGARRPRLDGLDITNLNFWANPPLLSVIGIDFSGRVEHTTVYYRPRLLQFSFLQCSLESGFYQVLSADPWDVERLEIRGSRLAGASSARVYKVVMEADTLDGGVAWSAREAWITHCWFRGGPGRAIELTYWLGFGRTANNRVEDYGTGVFVEDGNEYSVEDNMILRCGTGIQLWSGSNVSVVGNEIRDCGVGVDALNGGDLKLFRNTIIGASGRGIATMQTGVIAEENVVGRCGGDGIVLDYPDYTREWNKTVVWSNTVFKNQGDAIVVNTPLYPVAVERNIVYGNRGCGLLVSPGAVDALGCNDWFENGWVACGVVADTSDLSVDPLFCDVDGGDVRLDSASPLVDAPGCGRIGALGVGCGGTATLVQRFTAERARDGIRVVWEVAEGATASEIWLERSEAREGAAWTRPLTERSLESRAIVELDRSALPHRAYWYRLVALEGSDATVIGPPIAVEAQARLEFRLAEVGPNPGGGPVRIAFALEHAASIEIEVFDVQGRRVASPARGAWPAGTHTVEWNGRTRNGEPAPTGMYVVRYLYPGGRDRRAIVRVR